MILDGSLQFTGAAGAVNTDAPTTGTQVSTNVVDLVNARDMGIGDDPALKLLIQIMATFTVGTSLAVNLQGAPETALGSGVPGTYVTMWTSGVVLEASLLIGTYLSNVDLPRILLPTPLNPSAAMALPRYLRLQYVTVGTHTLGQIYAAIVLDRQDQISYPAGITVSN